MEAPRQKSGLLKLLHEYRVPVFIALAVIILFVVVIKNGTGFGPDKTVTRTVERNAQRQVVKIVTTTTPQSGKTLWDVLTLIGVPVVLLGLGVWLQEQQQRRSEQQAKLDKEREDQREEAERQRAEELSKREREVAEANQNEEALQAFIDRISGLLIDKRLNMVADKARLSKDEEEKALFDAAKDVIKASTLSILRRLGDDKERKEAVIRFLAEVEVIKKVGLTLEKVDLSEVDLSEATLEGIGLKGANLSNTTLSGTNLNKANLSEANLSHADLLDAKFEEADLSYAHLSNALLCSAKLDYANLNCAKLNDADLSNSNLSFAKLILAKLNGADLSYSNLHRSYLGDADFSGANLREADFSEANLRGVNFSGANLSGTDFSNTDLVNVKGLTKEQLNQALLCNTSLPEEYKALSNRDCEKLKKYKERGIS